MSILPMTLFTHPHVVRNLYDFISSVKHKRNILKNDTGDCFRMRLPDDFSFCVPWRKEMGEKMSLISLRTADL